MSGYLAFCDKYRDEAACIKALGDLKWPDGFSCARCRGRRAYHLASRPRLFECAACGHQHSVTAGTVFHKTRTALRKWFAAGYLIARDKRGVSALFISRELAIRYDTAWLMCHKIRHALTESSTDFLLGGCVEVDAAFYGGGRRDGDRRRARTDGTAQTEARGRTEEEGRTEEGRAQRAGRAMIVCAVEKRSTAGTGKQGIDRQGFIAGSARIAVLAHATARQIARFIRANIEAGSTILGDGGNGGRGPAEGRHAPIVPGTGVSAGVNLPIVHRLFSNVRTWLNGTYHGVSAKHLPRYLREWSYRFNRRGRIGQLDGFLLRRTVSRDTITYAELVGGKMIEGAG